MGMVLRCKNAILARTEKILSVFMEKDNKRSYIAMLHNVISDNEQKKEYEITFSEMDDYIQTYMKQGFTFVDLDELLESSKNVREKQIVLTFDDGFESLFTMVLPYMKKNKIPFTVYVTTTFLGQEGYLTKEQLFMLSQEPLCTIGMHAHEHMMFRNETDSKVQTDFEQCRDIIYEITNKLPTHYAFPYGSFYAVSKRNRKIIKRNNVKSISLTQGLKLRRKDIRKPFGLPRIDIPSYYEGNHKMEIELECEIND